MLALLCTAPQSSVSSPVEAFPPSSVTPLPTQNTSGAPSSSSSPTSSSKPASFPTRRPSIRKRIQSLSRVSGASLDKATASINTFLRSSSSSGSPSSPTKANATPGPSTGHSRGISATSFTSGKSGRSLKSLGASALSRSKLSLQNISPPSAFKHQFHLGPDSQASTGPWDEAHWRQVIEMRESENEDSPVIIDVVSSANETERKSTSSDRSASRAVSAPAHTSAFASSPNLLSNSTSNSNASAAAKDDVDGEAAEKAKVKAAKAAKRASLVKRKPVPPLYPEYAEPLPVTSTSPSPTPASYTLIPDLTPISSPEPVPSPAPVKASAPAPVQQKEEEQPEPVKEDVVPPAPLVSFAETTKKEVKVQTAKAAPAHVCILHAAPPPVPPPRRHTLAHMQARALGRVGGRSQPSPSAATATASKPVAMQSAAANPTLPPGLPASASDEKTETEAAQPAITNDEAAAPADNSPRPSFASLASVSSTQYGSVTGPSSSSESGEPRTPTDERRVSAGSVVSMSKILEAKEAEVDADASGDVTIVIASADDDDVDVEDREEMVMGEMRRQRRDSKRPNPPVRRLENEETVYMTADEADDDLDL